MPSAELKRVGVSPPAEHRGRPRLLAALEAAFPGRFGPAGDGPAGDFDAKLLFGPPALRPPADGVPSLVLEGGEAPVGGGAADIGLAADARLDRAVRGRTLREA